MTLTISEPRVVERVSELGYWYKTSDKELGPFTVQDEENPSFIGKLAVKLCVVPKDILDARLREIERSTTFNEIAEVLDTTLRHDLATKLILFSAGILNFTDQDQINILMAGESSGGKSYNALEVTSYFPQETLLTIECGWRRGCYRE